ncbi:MAG: endonuclease/exonuclease/phosphatase family protein [Cyclobacteriaceae bacterium]|nr:endonuclease/exonuclease/phosphatase family protein [Cyclobacteriaceae bacterium]
MRRLLKEIPIISASIISINITLGIFGSSNWILDLLSHFQFQYFVSLLIFIAIMMLYNWRLSLIFIPFLMLSAKDFLPLYYGGNHGAATDKTIKLVSINLLSSNGQFDNVLDYLKAKNPDIIILQEYTEHWQAMIGEKLEEYSFKREVPRSDNFGIAMFSKLGLDNITELDVSENGLPTLAAYIRLKDHKLRIIATHPLPPISEGYFKRRNFQLKKVGEFVSSYNGQSIVVGDLNTTSYSGSFKELLDSGGLQDSRKGFGLQTSWPTWFWPASITVDHFLHTNTVFIRYREAGTDIGSDHLPLYVEFGIIDNQ